ncbi:2-oxoglutarate synthase [Lasiodiplodia theobromae]|uniref:2-oxoglutarate synthase n=1 Tax=Lasiodiplodia theobromae TaxID=45133 RepID=UPI0015C3A242|nr:2-oxoglutarate synthase [Lasiodiplodia theobromae]KAF4543186.1 2-oxoglutarate synthase [Lasiodiplodia theobromae]
MPHTLPTLTFVIYSLFTRHVASLPSSHLHNHNVLGDVDAALATGHGAALADISPNAIIIPDLDEYVDANDETDTLAARLSEVLDIDDSTAAALDAAFANAGLEVSLLMMPPDVGAVSTGPVYGDDVSVSVATDGAKIKKRGAAGALARARDRRRKKNGGSGHAAANDAVPDNSDWESASWGPSRNNDNDGGFIAPHRIFSIILDPVGALA